MTDDDNKESKKLGRRDTLRLVTAASALGVGLGVILEAGDASAETYKIAGRALGKLSIKLYKFSPDNQSNSLVHQLDITNILTRGAKSGNYSVKLYNQKGETDEVVFDNEVQVLPEKA